MRFMLFMIPGVYQGGPASEAKEDFLPPADAVEKMMKFNEELANAGALISLDGLTPPSKGARVSFSGGRPFVTDGPFTESKEVVGGYWMIRANSRDEALEWAKKVPAAEGDVIEVRQVFEMSDFPEDVRNAADNPAVKAAVGQSKAARLLRIRVVLPACIQLEPARRLESRKRYAGMTNLCYSSEDSEAGSRDARRQKG